MTSELGLSVPTPFVGVPNGSMFGEDGLLNDEFVCIRTRLILPRTGRSCIVQTFSFEKTGRNPAE
jgi:hypothetical protein